MLILFILCVAFHVRDIVSWLERKSRDETKHFAAIRLLEDMKENRRKAFIRLQSDMFRIWN